MDRLRKSSQFERVRKEGRTWGSALVVLNAARNTEGTVRCGFISGKKIGKAVVRNRARRLIREAVRLKLPEVARGWDLVWIARSTINEASFQDVSQAVDALLRRARVLADRSGDTAGSRGDLNKQ